MHLIYLIMYSRSYSTLKADIFVGKLSITIWKQKVFKLILEVMTQISWSHLY